MKIINIFQIALTPLVLMAYGWYLGQLHQSGYDVAGIFLFITGALALVLAFAIRHLMKKFAWHDKWFVNILTGAVSCGVIFALVLLFARLHG